jgi:hypothetical protein
MIFNGDGTEFFIVTFEPVVHDALTNGVYHPNPEHVASFTLPPTGTIEAAINALLDEGEDDYDIAKSPMVLTTREDFKGTIYNSYCLICKDEDDHSGEVVTDCGHLYHDSCIQEWYKLHNRCPTCQTPLWA